MHSRSQAEKCIMAYYSQWIEWSASYSSFLFCTEPLAHLVMQLTEGESTLALSFISSDPLYKVVLHVATCREEEGVVKLASTRHWLGLPLFFNKFFDWTNTLTLALLFWSTKAVVQSSAWVSILVPPWPLHILIILPLSRNYLTSAYFSWCKLFLLFHSCYFSLCSNSGLVNLCCTVKNKHPRHTYYVILWGKCTYTFIAFFLIFQSGVYWLGGTRDNSQSSWTWVE